MEIKNRKALHDFEVIEKKEAGIQLMGHEVKSIRNSSAQLAGGFCKFVKGELFLFDVNISRYENTYATQHIEEKRVRKILLKRKELDKWFKAVNLNGLSIVPLSMYFNDKNICKIEICLVKGKKTHDKRNDLKEKDIQRQADIRNKDF